MSVQEEAHPGEPGISAHPNSQDSNVQFPREDVSLLVSVSMAVQQLRGIWLSYH
jgi:hypothetical protein